MFDEEESLGQATTPGEESLGDAVKKFDLKGFIQGVRPGRVSYRLYSRTDLDEEISRLRAEAMEVLTSGQNYRAQALNRKLKEAQEAYFAQSIDLVLEERSRDWTVRTTAELKQAGVSGHDITLGLVAGQIVEPAGVTGEDLRELAEKIPGQINGLVKAWGELQRLSEEQAKSLPVF